MTLNIQKTLGFCVAFLAISSMTKNTWAQQTAAICPAGLPSTAASSNFIVLSGGEVLHSASNLIFMQCSLGQTFDGTTCIGEPTPYTWQQALQVSLQTEFNGSKNWRVPNVKELSVITERACVRPSINDSIFPNTSPDDYWTSTPSIRAQNAAWAVAFTNASHSSRLQSRNLFVRLVRTRLSTE